MNHVSSKNHCFFLILKFFGPAKILEKYTKIRKTLTFEFRKKSIQLEKFSEKFRIFCISNADFL